VPPVETVSENSFWPSMVRDADSKLLQYWKDVYAHRHRSLNMTAQSSDEIQRKVEIQTMRTDYRLDARLETRYF
jgi:hypothetical protein